MDPQRARIVVWHQGGSQVCAGGRDGCCGHGLAENWRMGTASGQSRDAEPMGRGGTGTHAGRTPGA
eukprot:11100771-Alexandrium_andersonii.AAC.1